MEDLWDMPLVNDRDSFSLDILAKSLNKKVKEEQEDSFVLPATKMRSVFILSLDIVKRVIEVKLANIQTQNKRAATIARKNRILEILESKEDDSLKEKTREELVALLEEE